MVEAIRKLALGFQLVYMGMLFYVLTIVINIVLKLILVFTTRFRFQREDNSFETMLQMIGIASLACMFVGCVLGINGRYLCTLTPEIAQKARYNIRTSFALEMIAFILYIIFYFLSIPYILHIFALIGIPIGILPESHKRHGAGYYVVDAEHVVNAELVDTMYVVVNAAKYIVRFSSILYFVMYMRDLAGFVGSEGLSMRSERLRRFLVLLLSWSFIATVMSVAHPIVDRMVNHGTLAAFSANMLWNQFILLYTLVFFVIDIFVYFRYVRIIVAMTAVLKAYEGPTATQNGPSE